MIYEVVVRFGNTGQSYKYLTDIDNLKKGDHVIVDSANGIGLAKVYNYTKNTPAYKLYSWVLAKIDAQELRDALQEAKALHEGRIS